MKNKIILFTVLLSNIALASVVPFQTDRIQITKSNFNTVSGLLSINLYKRGLDKEVAQQKSEECLDGDDFTNSLLIHNIVAKLDKISYDDVIDYIATAALFNKRVDLSSYETLVAMMHKKIHCTLEKDMLDKIGKLSEENKQIKLFYSA